MVRLSSEKGFTLVELAIVMTIIGLLIGGILKGQMLMQNARVTAAVAEIKAVSAADTTFKDMYNAIPGDMPLAGTRLVGCPGAAGVDCNPLAANAGDGIVGVSTWATAGATWPAPAYGTSTVGAAPTANDDERYLFFSHLLLANLIGNVTTAGLSTATAYSFGVTHPNVKLSGGLQIGYDFGSISPVPAAVSGGLTAGTGITGTVLIEESGPELTSALGAGATGSYALTPEQCSQIDIKMDDGQPFTGYVQAFGVAAAFNVTVPANPTYNGTDGATDCGLIFRIES